MAFMQPQIVQDVFIEVEGDGTECFPQDVLIQAQWEVLRDFVELYDPTAEDIDAMRDVVADYVEMPRGRIQSVSARGGYGARLSAPGYMDCTSWVVFDTEEEAKAYLAETYPEEEEKEEEDGERFDGQS